jgi:hypothetical protein
VVGVFGSFTRGKCANREEKKGNIEGKKEVTRKFKS